MLEAFSALQYARRIYGKHHSVHFLWNKTYGPSIFHETMPRDSLFEINKFDIFGFDNKDRRRQRLTKDTFVHICEVFESNWNNCLFNYIPKWNLTVDEWLFPMKNKCPFIVYMPNKPDKFGMKFWILTEVGSKYVYKTLPYNRAQENVQRNGKPLPNSIHSKRGYNVMTDNFFTNIRPTSLLQNRLQWLALSAVTAKG